MVNTRFEHIAFNVDDMDAVAQWYVEHMGLKKIRYDEGVKAFLADQAGVVVLELYSNDQGEKFDLPKVHWLTLHMAFQVAGIESAIDELVAAGATIETPLSDSSGDKMVMLRDPFGLALQLVERKTSLLEG